MFSCIYTLKQKLTQAKEALKKGKQQAAELRESFLDEAAESYAKQHKIDISKAIKHIPGKLSQAHGN